MVLRIHTHMYAHLIPCHVLGTTRANVLAFPGGWGHRRPAQRHGDSENEVLSLLSWSLPPPPPPPESPGCRTTQMFADHRLGFAVRLSKVLYLWLASYHPPRPPPPPPPPREYNLDVLFPSVFFAFVHRKQGQRVRRRPSLSDFFCSSEGVSYKKRKGVRAGRGAIYNTGGANESHGGQHDTHPSLSPSLSYTHLGA